MAVEGVGQNIFLQAAQIAAGQQAQKAQKDEELKKPDKTKRKLFANAFEKSQKEMQVMRDGFPKEIAGLDVEEAAVYLKDQADMAADVLKEKQTPESFSEYRKKVSQFLKYVQKNNFEVKKRMRRGVSRRGKAIDPQYQIVIVNKKLEEMALWLLSSHRTALDMLARVDEIKGMLVDIMAS